MKISKFLPAFLLLVAVSGFSQPRFRQKLEQIKTLKVAYITDELQLTPDEAAKFWPVYNAYEDKQKDLRKEKAHAYLDRMDEDGIDKMSEKEAANYLSQMESTEDDLYQLKKKLIANLKVILPVKKIIMLQKAEEGFNRKLLKQYRDKAGKD